MQIIWLVTSPLYADRLLHVLLDITATFAWNYRPLKINSEMLSPYVPSVNFLVGAHLMRLFPSQKLQPGILHCIAFYCRWSFINYPSTCGFWRWPACRENMRQSWICKVHSPRELNELKVVIWRTSIVVLWMIDPPKIFDMIEQFISYTDRVILPRCSYDNSIPAGILSVNHTNPGIGSSEIVCPKNLLFILLDLICAQVHRVPQWAALSTHLSLRRVPPQKMFAKDVEEELERPTCHPISPLLAFCPPTILEPLTVFRPHLQLKK